MKKKIMLEIFAAKTDEDLELAKTLFMEYADYLKDVLSEYLTLPWFVDYLKGFEKELAALPGKYAPPEGCLLLAKYQNKIAGCVAFRELSDGICAMKRLFVRPEYQRKGVGTALCETLIEQAKKNGYIRMRLATALQTAKILYKTLGFKEIEPYRNIASEIKDVVFMELKLK